MPDPVDLGFAFGLAPKDAIEYFQSKGYKIGFSWRDVWQEAHAKAFTVAGVTKMDVLTDIREAVTDAIAKGTTFQEFENRLTPLLKKKGWYGSGNIADKETGEISGKRLAGRRLRTIFETNVQSSYMAGRYQQFMRNVDERPNWEYVAVMDSRTRPAHRALNGQIFPFDDPFWRSFYPPNGYRCRCRVRSHSSDDLQRLGRTAGDSRPYLGEADVRASKGSTDTVPVATFKTPAMARAVSPDPGFSFNAGQTWSELDGITWKRAQAFPPAARDGILAGVATAPARLAEYSAWVDRAVATSLYRGESRSVGFLSSADAAFVQGKGFKPQSGELVIEDRLLTGAKAVRHEAAGDALTAGEWKRLPAGLAEPEAVLWHVQRQTLLYVFAADDSRKIKVAVEIDRWSKRRKASEESLRTAYKERAEDLAGNLRGGTYELVRGSLE